MNRIAVFATLLLFPAAVLAAPPDKTNAPVPDKFMEQLVAGINGRDLGRIRALIHPATLECMTPATEEYYASFLWKDGSRAYSIPSDYSITLEQPIDAAQAAASPKAKHLALKTWPVQPDTGFYINYHSTPTSVIQRLFEITLRNGEAKLVMDCHTALGLENFQQVRRAQIKQAHKLEHIWQSLGPQEKQAFFLMAGGGMKLDGIDAAEQKFHLNMTESLAFMDMIEYENTP